VIHARYWLRGTPGSNNSHTERCAKPRDLLTDAAKAHNTQSLTGNLPTLKRNAHGQGCLATRRGERKSLTEGEGRANGPLGDWQWIVSATAR